MRFKGNRLVTAIALLLLLAALTVEAQQTKVMRIGLLASASREARGPDAFWQGMRERGWLEGQNFLREERWAEGRDDRLASLAAELIRLRVDVIVAPSQAAALAAKTATVTIPVVMIAYDDPVRSGLVANLARPGGNVTGLSMSVDVGIIGKQLQILAEAIPKLSHVAVLRNPADPTAAAALSEADRAARLLGARVQAVNVRSPDQLEEAFAAMTRERAGAVLVPRSGMLFVHRSRLAALAAKHKLPSILPDGRWVADGGLMSYGPDNLDLLRRAATYVDKILKGAKPGDLPVELPTKFELVVNMKTAKALSLTFPASVLAQAGRVIE